MPGSRQRFSLMVPFLVWMVATVVVGVLLFVFSNASDRAVAARTIGLGLSASAIAIPIGGLIAWVCRGTGFISRMMLVGTMALVLIPMFIHVSGWDAAFGKLGWLTSVQGKALQPIVSGWTAAAWIHGIAAAPQVALVLLIGMSIGGRIFEEQASLDTSELGVFWHVTFKRLWPLLILSVIWIVVSCAREIAVTDIYQIGTLSEQIYLGYSLGLNSIQGTWTPDQLAAAGEIGPKLTISIIAWLALTGFCLFMFLTDLEFESQSFKPTQSKPASAIQKTCGLALILLTMAIPIGNVIVRACFFVRPVDGIPTKGYSIAQMFGAIRRSVLDYQNEFIWSFLISAVSATLIILFASLLSFAARRSRAIQVLFAILLAVSCALPGPWIGTTIASIFVEIENETLGWFYNYTIAAPVIANLIFCWPVGALVVWFVFRKIPQDALDSSSVDGAGKTVRFFRFGVAGNLMAIIGCWMISFAFCFGELSASHIVRPPGIDTVPRKMLGDLHAGVNELTAGITIVTAAAVITISLVGWWFIRLNQSHNGRQ
ncbi:MAG: hypothetical protein AB8B55_05870 [Mariniblastus sp.]